MDSRLPTHDKDAEKFVLSAILNSQEILEEVAEILVPADFFMPLHQEIYSAMIAMFTAEPITPVTLKAWMDRDKIKVDKMYLFDLWHLNVLGTMAVPHARIIWDCSVRRKIEYAGHRLSQLSGDMSQDPEDLLAQSRDFLETLAARCVVGDAESLTTEQFLALPTARNSAVIEGLLDHEDRVIVVAGEGMGKTVLAQQVAYALAAGTHPFLVHEIPAGRSLIVDLENPRGILQRRFRQLRETAERYQQWRPVNLQIFARPGGVDLLRATDAMKLAEVIRRFRPDLIVAGPVYKMFEESGEHDTHKHSAIARYFDKIRERHGSAIWLETHAPIGTQAGKRDMRPMGSGVWTRWPEFGLTLNRASKVKGGLEIGRFRGDREEGRMWPQTLTRKPPYDPGWPWQASYPDGTLTTPMDQAS